MSKQKPATVETAGDKPDCAPLGGCACCHDDIKAILKWINDVTEELRDLPTVTTQRANALWNIRAELDNDIQKRSTHNNQAHPTAADSDRGRH